MITSAISSLGVVPGQNITPDTFSDSQIQAAEALVVAFLSEAFPDQDFDSGTALNALLVRSMAMIYLTNRLEWETLRATQSLGALLAQPSLVSNEVVDLILSNFRISRRLGASSQGRIKISLSRMITQVVTEDFVFSTQDGAQFVPAQAYRLIDEVQDDGDLKMYAEGDGAYVLLPVVASKVGSSGQIKDGTPLSSSTGIAGFVTAHAFGDFYGGAEDETNDELLARLPSAMTVKNLVTPLSIQSVIIDQFPEVSDVSVQGAFDPAMTRNSHGILGFKSGGFADIYFKTSAGIIHDSVSLSATLQEITGEGDESRGLYAVSLSRDMMPGHYFVTAVRTDSAAAGSFYIKQETKGMDLSRTAGATQVHGNQIFSTNEAAYSKYQTSVILFEIEFDPSAGNTPEEQFDDEITVTVESACLPYVADIQDFVLERGNGVVLADYLVKAVIPCFVRLPVITIDATTSDILSTVRETITQFINSLKIGADLRVDELVMKIRAVSGVLGVRLPIRFSGEIFAPDGTVIPLSSSGNLKIPRLPDSLIVPENTAFFIEPSDINISIVTN